MASLYEINQQIEEAFAKAVDPETGEISEEAIELINALQLEKDTKIENVALWHKNTVADIKAIGDEIKALQDRKKRLESKQAWMDKYLESALNGQKFETPKVAITYRKSTTVEIPDVPKFVRYYSDTEYVIEKVDYAPDKAAIKEAIKAGEFIEGAALVEHQNMQIK